MSQHSEILERLNNSEAILTRGCNLSSCHRSASLLGSLSEDMLLVPQRRFGR